MLTRIQELPITKPAMQLFTKRDVNVSKTNSTSKNKSLAEDEKLKNSVSTKNSKKKTSATKASEVDDTSLDLDEDKTITSKEKKSSKKNESESVIEFEIIDPELEEKSNVKSSSDEENIIDIETLDDENDDLDENDESDDNLFTTANDIDFDSYDEYSDDDVLNQNLNALPAENSGNLPEIAKPRLPNVFSKDGLNLYLSEISSFPMLKPEEEVELAQKVRDHNDPDAAFRLVSSHLRLVVRIAMEFQRRWMQNVLDLVQEGNIGLLRAVNKFDPDKGIKFSYYATFWIRAYILKFIMDNWRMVKIGTTQAQRKLFYNLNKEKQKLIAQGFDPDLEVLSERLGVSKEQIVEMEQRLDSTDMSLDMPVGEENNTVSRIDYLPALTQGVEEGFAENEITDIIHEKLEKLLPKLSDKEIFILENRLLTDDPITLREIGEKYNVTRERIRQLEARLVAKMKTYLTDEIEDFSEDWIQQ